MGLTLSEMWTKLDRGSRRNFARANGMDWRALPRFQNRRTGVIRVVLELPQ